LPYLVKTTKSDTGLALTVDQFHELANRLRSAGVKFIIEPHLRFKGMPGEQYTMFFKDPSGSSFNYRIVLPRLIIQNCFIDRKYLMPFSFELHRQ
jgi:hypothetical protein